MQSLMQGMVKFQKKLKPSKVNKKKVEVFVNLVLRGKVGVPAKRINNEDSVKKCII